jgi:hypothetical protein
MRVLYSSIESVSRISIVTVCGIVFYAGAFKFFFFLSKFLVLFKLT